MERRANLTPLDYRHTEDIGEEQIPGPPQVGGRYLLVCEQSLQLETEWRETRLIMEGEAPTPPLYTRARIVPLHEVESVVTQTMPPPATETGMTTRFGNRPYKDGYGTNWGPHTGGRDRSMDASKLHKVAGRKQGDTLPYARGPAPYRAYKCIRPLSRARALQDRTFGESPHRRNRRRVRCLRGLIDDPCAASWFVCFPVPLWGRAKPLEHYNALRATICVCAIPASTAYADCASGAYPKLGSSGSTSYYACNATTEIRTKIYGSPVPPPMEVGPLPARDPGFPPPVEGLSKSEEIARYLSLSSLLSSQMRWYSEMGLVVPSWCARHISLLHQKVNQLQQLQHVAQP